MGPSISQALQYSSIASRGLAWNRRGYQRRLWRCRYSKTFAQEASAIEAIPISHLRRHRDSAYSSTWSVRFSSVFGLIAFVSTTDAVSNVLSDNGSERGPRGMNNISLLTLHVHEYFQILRPTTDFCRLLSSGPSALYIVLSFNTASVIIPST